MTVIIHRRIEIDIARTVAIILMVAYHAAYDLAFFADVPIDPLHGWWKVLARTAAILFLLIVGVSFWMSWQKRLAMHGRDAPWGVSTKYRHYAARGFTIIAWGMAISLATYIMDPDTYVQFGILHLIGMSVLLLPFFAELGSWSILAGIAVILAQMALPTSAPTSIFLPLGIPPASFTTVDYFPLIPWFGVVLMGMGLGYAIYGSHQGMPRPVIVKTPQCGVSTMGWPGRHSLMIYLIHQPILIGLVWLFHH